MDISVVIPTCNRAPLLRKCLSALVGQQFPRHRYEVIVCNDGSTDGTEAAVRSIGPGSNVRYFRHEKNKGASAARNLGISQARGRIVAFLDDDCLPAKDWLAGIQRMFKEHPAVQIVQGRIDLPRGRHPILLMQRAVREFADRQRIVDAPGRPHAGYRLFDNLAAGNVAFRKSALVKYGLFFDENLKKCEDSDLYHRAKALGLDIAYGENIAVTHMSPRDFPGFVRGYFSYGMGRYHIHEKWKGKPGVAWPKAKLTLNKLVQDHGLYWGIIIRLLIAARDGLLRLGQSYEKFKIERTI